MDIVITDVSTHLFRQRAQGMVDYYNAGRDPGPYAVRSTGHFFPRWKVIYIRPNERIPS